MTSSTDQQKIVEGFQKLREQQQQTVTEISRVESELREHQLVYSDCLVEHKAGELVEILSDIVTKFKERLKELNEQLIERGKEINSYKEKNNIRLLSQKDLLELQKKQALEKISQLAKPDK
ncbi:prefoldin subunit 2 [Ditylenchus destructor]|uniref:Prefoldin subunit 2 n=1 Tax=Ditylenchus destructor TaxID=166010 RepID=A0AAD4N3H2_9BILA|nr:prefoldin subunit 2 [Ditylenchus destructor]